MVNPFETEKKNSFYIKFLLWFASVPLGHSSIGKLVAQTPDCNSMFKKSSKLLGAQVMCHYWYVIRFYSPCSQHVPVQPFVQEQ